MYDFYCTATALYVFLMNTRHSLFGQRGEAGWLHHDPHLQIIKALFLLKKIQVTV